jgi:hypothetical protein
MHKQIFLFFWKYLNMKLSIIYITSIVCLSPFLTHGAEQKTTAAKDTVSREIHLAAHQLLMMLRAPKPSHKQQPSCNVVYNAQKSRKKQHATQHTSSPIQLGLQSQPQQPLYRQLLRPVDEYSRQQDKVTPEPQTVLAFLKSINSHSQGS